ncbi:MAG: HD domain-containing protein [Sedimentisphaerales bacterium]|nr:HD domain-containing protein [Sedimentisphaerales bacterium]
MITDKSQNICVKLIDEMKEVFGNDSRRIEHALTVLQYAEQISQKESGDILAVKAAAILHDIGIHEAERKYNSAAGQYQEIEGPPIARRILEKYDIDKPRIEHICRIIANHHSAKDIDTTEFRIIWDADWLVNLAESDSRFDKDKLTKIIDKTFKTDRGRQIARQVYIGK